MTVWWVRIKNVVASDDGHLASHSHVNFQLVRVGIDQVNVFVRREHNGRGYIIILWYEYHNDGRRSEWLSLTHANLKEELGAPAGSQYINVKFNTMVESTTQ